MLSSQEPDDPAAMAEERETHADIEAGLRELAAGGGRSLEDFDEEMRKEFGMEPNRS